MSVIDAKFFYCFSNQVGTQSTNIIPVVYAVTLDAVICSLDNYIIMDAVNYYDWAFKICYTLSSPMAKSGTTGTIHWKDQIAIANTVP